MAGAVGEARDRCRRARAVSPGSPTPFEIGGEARGRRRRARAERGGLGGKLKGTPAGGQGKRARLDDAGGVQHANQEAITASLLWLKTVGRSDRCSSPRSPHHLLERIAPDFQAVRSVLNAWRFPVARSSASLQTVGQSDQCSMRQSGCGNGAADDASLYLGFNAPIRTEQRGQAVFPPDTCGEVVPGRYPASHCPRGGSVDLHAQTRGEVVAVATLHRALAIHTAGAVRFLSVQALPDSGRWAW